MLSHPPACPGPSLPLFAFSAAAATLARGQVRIYARPSRPLASSPGASARPPAARAFLHAFE